MTMGAALFGTMSGVLREGFWGEICAVIGASGCVVRGLEQELGRRFIRSAMRIHGLDLEDHKRVGVAGAGRRKRWVGKR